MLKNIVAGAVFIFVFCYVSACSCATETGSTSELPIAIKWKSQCIKMGGVTKGRSNGSDEIEFHLSYQIMTSDGPKWFSAFVFDVFYPLSYLDVIYFEFPIYESGGGRAYNPDGTPIWGAALTIHGSPEIEFAVYSHTLVGGYWLYGNYYEDDYSISWYIGNTYTCESP